MAAPDPRIEFFNHHAPTWDTYGPPHARILARLDALRPRLDLRSGQDVLEVGCGTGQVTEWLARCVHPGRVTAVDFSPAMLELARQRGVAAEFVDADVCRDDLGRARFDVVLCLHSFPHFRDQSAALERFARALRPAGRLIILHLDNWRAINAFHDHVGGAVAGDHLPDPTTLTRMLHQVQLDVVELVDEPDLFYLSARRAAVTTPGPTTGPRTAAGS